MLTSRRQKAIIRRICSAQEKSFLRIVEFRVKQIKDEMNSEGYNISESDILEQISLELEQWDKAKADPVMFINLLDEQNKGMVKHYLVNSFLKNPDSKPIWKILNLYEQSNQFPN
jgi:hypothetical protein